MRQSSGQTVVGAHPVMKGSAKGQGVTDGPNHKLHGVAVGAKTKAKKGRSKKR